jgi:charged multivesicular body protein 3
MGAGKSVEARQQSTKEHAREWQRQLRGEARRLDRDIARLRQEEAKLKKEITSMAAKGQPQSVQALAKQVVRSRKAVTRLERTKCSMNAVSLHLTTGIASMSTASSLKMSAKVMTEMNRLMNVPELAKTMEEMRQEMARAEIMDEVMEETFEESDEEADVDTEMQKVFDDLALDRSQFMATASEGVPAPQRWGLQGYVEQPAAAAPAQPAEDPLMARLQALSK